MSQKLASIAFAAEPGVDVERLVTRALDAHVGTYALKGWKVSFGLLQFGALETIRDMMKAGDLRAAADLTLYCGSIPAEEWLFSDGYRIQGHRLDDPVLGETYLFTWE